MDLKDFRKGAGPHIMGVVTILALLMTLHQVLQKAVHQGATVKAAYAELSKAQWRCSSTQGPRQRDHCIAQRVLASSRDGALLLASAGMRAQ